MLTSGPLRTSASGLAATAVLALAWLPPAHAHLTHADDGHTAEVVHRHYEAHHPADHDTAIDHADEDVVRWLGTVLTGPPKTVQVSPDYLLLHEALAFEPAPPTVGRAFCPLHVSVHDPPWTTSVRFRGPPSVSCLT